jgi:arylsulfatase A-like enzyme
VKKLLRWFLVVLYLGAVVISFLILVKPGAAIFFIKRDVDRRAIVKDTDFAYRYRLDVNPYIIRVSGIQVYENGQLLALTSSNIVANSGNSTYAISAESNGLVYIYFSASDNSSPITNGRSYTLYLPLTIISRATGLACLILLIPLFLRFVAFALVEDGQRKLLTRSPAGIFQVLDRYFDQSLPKIPSEIRELWHDKTRASLWKRLFTLMVLVAYFYIFMEWLFYATMPSFMSLTSFFNKLEILLLSGWVLSAFCLIGIIIFLLLDVLAQIATNYRITHYLELLVPSIVLSSLVLLLVDNFTYTIFKFGIITSTGVVRGAYGLFFVFVTGYICIKLLGVFGLRGNPSLKHSITNQLFFLAIGLVVLSSGFAIATLDYSSLISPNREVKTQGVTNQPNIILLGGDGLSANHLSVYGYERDTTPRLSELAQTSLLADNAFSNASKTAGSIVSLMTSKLPTQTRVMFPPNILTGINAYQHLPGILKNAGYETVEFGVPYYIDAYDYNFQNAFDMVNNRYEDENRINALGRKLGYNNVVYFMNKIYGRISDRIQHILFLRVMPDPYQIVTHPVQFISDQQKIQEALDLLDHSNKPLFIHIHLLGTHGPKFAPSMKFFSKGEVQDENLMTDFYDDAILDFDRYVGDVIDHLSANGQIDNTLLIIYTDHNYETQIPERIPLIFHFPFNQYAGQIECNVQNMDIAPTILDYLGIPIPEWMDGKSLMHGELDSHRLIFGTMLSGEAFSENNQAQLDLTRLKPPFYQFSYLDVIDCQRWYVLNLVDNIWSSGDVAGYEFPCSQDSLLSFEEIKQAAIDQLTKDGFNASSIR